jgi:hypothetical protein
MRNAQSHGDQASILQPENNEHMLPSFGRDREGIFDWASSKQHPTLHPVTQRFILPNQAGNLKPPAWDHK